jgi:hypothetical protein
MSSGASAGSGVRHLAALAREPRPAGSDAEDRARRYAEQVLRDAGFSVMRESFSYSAFPGRYGTPIGGAIGGVTALCSAWLGLTRRSGVSAAVGLMVGIVALVAFARAMLGDAVLVHPWMRAQSVNVVATRAGQTPRVWLVAHTDSKSQPVPSLVRMAGISLLAAALVLALVAAALQLAALPSRMTWWVAILAAVLGAPPVVASVVGAKSDGALDNATGVAAVLAAAQLLDPRAAVGVLLPSAEELGLAGARAWAVSHGGGHAPGVALNCDGVDDEGELTIMHGANPPADVIAAIQRMSPRPPTVRRMPAGLLTDSVALADAGWRAVTLSRGSFASLRRVHTPGDSLAKVRGTGVDEAAAVLARAAEALA